MRIISVNSRGVERPVASSRSFVLGVRAGALQAGDCTEGPALDPHPEALDTLQKDSTTHFEILRDTKRAELVACLVGGARLAPERPDPPRWAALLVHRGARGGTSCRDFLRCMPYGWARPR
jgi:hypothetical protein